MNDSGTSGQRSAVTAESFIENPLKEIITRRVRSWMVAFLYWCVIGSAGGLATAIQNGSSGLLMFSTVLAGAIVIAPMGMVVCFGIFDTTAVPLGAFIGATASILIAHFTRPCMAECMIAGSIIGGSWGSLRVVYPKARKIVFQ